MKAAKFRTYNELAGDDRSQLLAQVLRQRERVTQRLDQVHRVIAIMSGKGGVGKSYVAAGLALACSARNGQDVGLLDADLNGPTAAALLAATGPLSITEAGIEPATGRHGVKVFSTDLLVAKGQPLRWKEPGCDAFLWRNTLETATVREFLSDVVWGDLDLLFIDLPPGSARLADIAQLIPDLNGVIAVTIPSEESRQCVERSLHAARQSGIPLLGIVENMSGYYCSDCHSIRPLFPGRAGRDLAQQFGLPLLGQIPFCSAAGNPERAEFPLQLTDTVCAALLERLQ